MNKYAIASDAPASDGISLSGVSKRIRGKTVLDSITAEFPQGRISGIRGHNGSGKTMLLRAIAGLIKVDAGKISVLGRDITHGDIFPESMGFLIKPMKLWDDLTGFQNLKMLASIHGLVGEGEIQEALRRVGLDHEDCRWVRSYSLGMCQRLCIAQAIMEQPKLILLDEPTSALDADGRSLIRELIIEERRRGATVVIVSHDAGELKAVADCQYEMAGGKMRREW